MIKKFIQRLFGQGDAAPAEAAAAPAVPVIPLGARAEIAASEHRIDPKLLDANAVRVVRTLKDAGYEAYVVAAPCATCSWACAPRTSTSPPTPRPSR